jgi:short-subunit dehydrogenase
MGQLLAWRMAAKGVAVAAVDVNEAGLAKTAAQDGSIRTYVCDVTDSESVSSTVKRAEEDCGPLERVVNAAAIARVGPLVSQSPAEIRRMMDINFGGTAEMVAATLPGMLERGRGQLVIFASMAGWISQPKMGAYCATKFATVAYAEALWMENRGKGVQFACVCPPAVKTPMLPDFFALPKNQKKSMAIKPEQVLDELERVLAKDGFLVLPTVQAKVLYRIRRFTPNVLRKVIGSPYFDLIT